jgi:GT2 family glycosyltransferase
VKSDPSLSPIVLLVYNRLEHTEKTVNALLANELAQSTELFIYSDNASEYSMIEKVKQVRSYIKTIKGFSKINIIERNENFGLARNIISSVTEVVEKYGKVIVLEDDIITSPGFLNFMNDALNKYEDLQEVMHVSGYMYPLKIRKHDILFLRVLSCWGWGTWKRAWTKFSDDSSKFLKLLNSKEKITEFNIGGNADFMPSLKQIISIKLIPGLLNGTLHGTLLVV